jgi:xanthine dehydrogenase accessory factor
VSEGFKIADIDPRREQYENCFTISDKARALGGAVVMELVGYAARKAVDE